MGIEKKWNEEHYSSSELQVFFNQSKNKFKDLWRKAKSILPTLALAALLTWGVVTSCKNEDKNKLSWEQVIDREPSISKGDVAVLQKIFPPRRQQTEVDPLLAQLEKDGMIQEIETSDDIPKSFIDLERDHGDKFAFHEVNYPYVHPDFATILLDISKEFNSRLSDLWYKWDYVKIMITSLTRPVSANNNLHNASKKSSHRFWVAADIRIVKDRFETNSWKETHLDEDLFMFVLVDVLDDFQANWDVIVMAEKNPPHLHVNIGDWKKRVKSPTIVQMREDKEISLYWSDEQIESADKSEFSIPGGNYSDLYAAYLWHFTKDEKWNIAFGTTSIWDTIYVPKNVDRMMDLLRQKKFQRKNVKDFVVAKDFYDDVVAKKDFNKSLKSDIQEYRNDIKRSVNSVVANFDFKKAGVDTKNNNKSTRNDDKQLLWEKMIKWIDENVILSYNMTEFFPSWAPAGKVEYWMLDHMLKQYGKDFIFYIPAMADDYASFWPYQFTSLALADLPWKAVWVSVMNGYLPKEIKVPGSVTKLRNDDHHRAAVLFAMYNLRSLIIKMDDSSVNTLLKKDIKKLRSTLAQIIAIWHNMPGDLARVANIISSVVRNDYKLFHSMKGRHTEWYAKKTYANYLALKNWVVYKNEPTIVYVDWPSIKKRPQNQWKIKTTAKEQSKQTKKQTPDVSSKKSPLEYKNPSKDGKASIYTYTLQSGWDIGWIKNNVSRILNVKKSKIKVVTKSWQEYSTNRSFQEWVFVYIRVEK